jgi:hypothetical protein
MSLQLFRDFCKCISQTVNSAFKINNARLSCAKSFSRIGPSGPKLRKIHEMFPGEIGFLQPLCRFCSIHVCVFLLQLLSSLATDLDNMLSELCTTPPPPYDRLSDSELHTR